MLDNKHTVNITIDKVIIYECCDNEDKPHKVRLVLTTLINFCKLEIMSLSIASNQQTLGQLLLKDVVTQAPVSATFANTTATSSDSSLFTVDLNSTVDVINVKAVSVGAGTISITSDASYTDSLGAPQTKSLTLSVDVLITQVSADDVALDIRFAAPTPL